MAASGRWRLYVVTAACMLSACGTQLGFNIWANSIKDKFMLTQTQGKSIKDDIMALRILAMYEAENSKNCNF